MLQEKQCLELKIDSLDDFGRGIAKFNGLVIFVNQTLPGDLVKIELTKVSKKYAVGQVLSFIKTSDLRKESNCPYSSKCGGCQLLNLSLDEQLKYKKEKIEKILYKFTKEEIKVNNVYKTREFNYRNKVVFHVKNHKLGFYESKTNCLLEIDRCLLLNENINDLISKLKKIVRKEETDIKDITIKTNGNDLMVIISGQCDKDLLKDLDVEVLYLNNELLTKNDYILTSKLDKKFKLSQNSFFQINPKGEEVILNTIINFVKDRNFNTCLDLYCGRGTTSIILSDYIKNIIGVEIVEDAVKDAFFNKELNNASNVSFVLLDVKEVLSDSYNVDLVLVDPPREGLSKSVVESILKAKPKSVIYISCNPVTLARDLSLFNEKYKINNIDIVDMFPNTYHVESIVSLDIK